LGFAPQGIAAAWPHCRAEGFALRGRFSAQADGDEWCERRLLARVHHYTVKRLRAEIEPVAARDFMRFLFAWQRVAADARMEGPEALDIVASQLEGFEAPAAAWESEILPAASRAMNPIGSTIAASRPADMARLRPLSPRPNGGEGRVAPVRTTPITLLARRHAALWASLSPKSVEIEPSSAARAVADYIRQHGASFFDELVGGAGLLANASRRGLSELVALGLVSSDSFAGLRALLVPSNEKKADRARTAAAPDGKVRHGGSGALGARSPCAGSGTRRQERKR